MHWGNAAMEGSLNRFGMICRSNFAANEISGCDLEGKNFLHLIPFESIPFFFSGAIQCSSLNPTLRLSLHKIAVHPAPQGKTIPVSMTMKLDLELELLEIRFHKVDESYLPTRL